jgi:type I restriction enzyme S subunit
MSREISKEWDQVCLGEVCDIKIGGTPSRSVQDYWSPKGEDGHWWASITDLTQGTVIATRERITDAGIANSNVKLIKAGTVLMSFKLTIGRVALAGTDLYTNEAIAAFEPDVARLSKEYLYHALSVAVSFAETDQAVKGKTLNKAKLAAIVLPLPPLSEQRRIAEILSTADEAIQATKAANDQIEVIRAKALEELFPANLKVGMLLPDKFIDWRVIPAHEAAIDIVDCKNRTPPRTESGYAVVRTPNVRHGRFIEEGLHFTDAISFAEWIRKGRPQPGDILFTREAPFGEVCAAPQSLDFCLGQRMMFFRPNPDILSSTYLLYALQSAGIQKDLLFKAGGSTVGHLRVADVRNIPIPLAPKGRQEEIERFFISLDKMADTGERNLKQLQKVKSALVSDLLSGRKRVYTDLLMAAE